MTENTRPPRDSLLGAIGGLCVAEHMGDAMDEVFTICRLLGIPEPVEIEPGEYAMPWQIEDEG